jgi:hypothetical protein
MIRVSDLPQGVFQDQRHFSHELHAGCIALPNPRHLLDLNEVDLQVVCTALHCTAPPCIYLLQRGAGSYTVCRGQACT